MTDHKKIINKYKKEILKKDQVVGVGYGLKEKHGHQTEEKAIIVFVQKKLPEDKVKNKDLVPQVLNSYKTDVVEIGEVRFLQSRTSRVRPAQPGISIGHYKVSAGTFGAVVRDKKSGKKLILSNNHVLANISNGYDDRANIGDPILQPGIYDEGSNPSDVIANLKRFIPIKKGEEEPDCQVAITVEKIANYLLHLIRPNYNLKFFKGKGGNLVDCAVAEPRSLKDVSAEVLGIGSVKSIVEPAVEMKVKKSGRTSGITTGSIKAVEASVNVNMGDDQTATFNDQFVVTPMSRPGDSGSLVINEDNNAVGLLFAGSDKATVCNRISNVFELLEVEF